MLFLSRQKFCCIKDNFVMTKLTFIATNECLLRQNTSLLQKKKDACRDKNVLSGQAYFCYDKTDACGSTRQ